MASDLTDKALTAKIHKLVDQAFNNRLFPGIEILCARGSQITFHRSYGKIDQKPDSPLLENDSIFDLASLTKPLATASAVMHLVDSGRLNPNDAVAGIISEFSNSEKSTITISQLLTHSAGLVDWLPLYEPDFSRERAWEKLVSTPLGYTPGSSVRYSCLGYIVLAEIVRRITGKTLAEYCESNLFVPLGLSNMSFHPNPEKRTVIPTAYCPLRKKTLQGIVHDENAHAFGGEGGNAGLFGTATEIHSYCLMLLSSGKLKEKRIFSDNAINGMLRNQTPDTIPARTYGWDVNDGSESDMSCGSLMPLGSIGHLGFTGTSIWMDPVLKVIIILLSNRVNISREESIPMMRIFRPKLHTLLLSSLLEQATSSTM